MSAKRPTDVPGHITKAMLILQRIALERKLAEIARDHNFTKGQYVYLWQLKEGRRRPSYDTMVVLQDVISIDDWFEEADESDIAEFNQISSELGKSKYLNG